MKAYHATSDGGAAAAWSAEEASASTVAATAAGTVHHMLKLEGYSLLKQTHGKSGSRIDSCAFKAGGHTWRIKCFLNGETKEHAGFVSLFLYLCSDPAAAADVHAEFGFALVRHHGTPPPPARKMRSTVKEFWGKGKSYAWGFSRFIGVEELERSGFLKDDCLAVLCTVTVVRERTVEEKALQARDLARLGMLCKCNDHLCKRHHARPAAETFLERFAKFCYSICRGPAAPLK